MACLNFTLYLNSTFPRNLWTNDVRSLTKLCQQFDLGDFSIEIVHLADEPRRGFHDGVFSTPTILLEQKNGSRRILGNFSDTEEYLQALHRPAVLVEMPVSPVPRALLTHNLGAIALKPLRP
jgi:hypothetical protein